MFNWSGNKGSFTGDIPFYGKTGLEFYTQRKVSKSDVAWVGAMTDFRPPLPSGHLRTPSVTRRPSPCPNSTNPIVELVLYHSMNGLLQWRDIEGTYSIHAKRQTPTAYPQQLTLKKHGSRPVSSSEPAPSP